MEAVFNIDSVTLLNQLGVVDSDGFGCFVLQRRVILRQILVKPLILLDWRGARRLIVVEADGFIILIDGLIQHLTLILEEQLLDLIDSVVELDQLLGRATAWLHDSLEVPDVRLGCAEAVVLLPIDRHLILH